MNLEEEIKRYSKLNGYPINSFYELKCSCGSGKFKLYSNDDEGGAYVECCDCHSEIDIENSRDYIEESDHNICNCDNECLGIGVGTALYDNTDDPRWIYIGASCHNCGLVGVYVDWKES